MIQTALALLAGAQLLSLRQLFVLTRAVGMLQAEMKLALRSASK